MVTASIIVGFVLSAYSIAGAIWGSIQTNRLQEQAQKIANAVNKNAELKTKVLQAYQDKDYKLGAALINNSPIGSAYSHLQGEISKAKKEYDDKMNDIEDSDKQLREASEGMKTPTSDLVGAIVNTAQRNDDKINSALETSNSLIEGGMKNG